MDRCGCCIGVISTIIKCHCNGTIDFCRCSISVIILHCFNSRFIISQTVITTQCHRDHTSCRCDCSTKLRINTTDIESICSQWIGQYNSCTLHIGIVHITYRCIYICYCNTTGTLLESCLVVTASNTRGIVMIKV